MKKVNLTYEIRNKKTLLKIKYIRSVDFLDEILDTVESLPPKKTLPNLKQACKFKIIN